MTASAESASTARCSGCAARPARRNEWAAIGIAPEWLHDEDAALIRESNANHIRFMHVAGSPTDIRAFDRHGIVCTQPAGDKEKKISVASGISAWS